MPPVLAIPLRDRGIGLHLLDDIAPADARVVRAEADLPHLRAVGDDAHLRAAKIVVVEVLKPHPRDEERAPLEGFCVARRLADLAAPRARLAEELLDEMVERETFRRGARVEVLQQREARLGDGDRAALCPVGDVLHVAQEAVEIQERGQRHHFFRPLVDEEHRAEAAVGVAPALHRAPVRVLAEE